MSVKDHDGAVCATNSSRRLSRVGKECMTLDPLAIITSGGPMCTSPVLSSAAFLVFVRVSVVPSRVPSAVGHGEEPVFRAVKRTARARVCVHICMRTRCSVDG